MVYYSIAAILVSRFLLDLQEVQHRTTEGNSTFNPQANQALDSFLAFERVVGSLGLPLSHDWEIGDLPGPPMDDQVGSENAVMELEESIEIQEVDR